MIKTHTKLIIILVFIIGILLQGCTTEGPTNNNYNQQNTIYVDIKGTTNYSSIQEAIDASPENYTIFILKGNYRENIIINKTLTIKGEDPKTTIIDGTQTSDTVTIDKENVLISGLTITNSSKNANKAGIRINKNRATINNNILKDNVCGIYSNRASHNYVHNNTITANRFNSTSMDGYGIYVYAGSNNMKIHDNLFYENDCSLRVKGSQNCEIFRNQFNNSKKGMYFCCGARMNSVIGNTFRDHSTWNADDQVGSNEWNDSIGQGNYWDDYTGVDENGDGIGDTPYEISSYRSIYDEFPLMEPPVEISLS